MTRTNLLNDITTTCAVCGSRDAVLWRVSGDNLLGGPDLWRAVRCARCQTRRLDPRPPAREMARFYAPDTYARAEEANSEVGKRLDAYNARVAARADLAVPAIAGRRLNALDVGCGDGRFMAALAQLGWSVAGTETDSVAADLARRRAHATIYEVPTEALDLPTESFDLVSLLHVLEHVPDPAATLATCFRLLRPGGALLLALPNAQSAEARLFGSAWYHLDLPRHLWGFTPGSLARLTEQLGFERLSLRYFPFLFAPQSGVNALRGLRRRRASPSSSGGDNARNNPKRETGGRLQTRVFLGLLSASERLGQNLPGEIMELIAYRPLAATDAERQL